MRDQGADSGQGDAEPLRRQISALFGLELEASRVLDLSAALRSVAARYRLPEATAVSMVACSPTLLRAFAGELSVLESHFFRPPHVWDVLVRELARRVQAGRTVQVLSAGCCRGEEPYSLALALEEHLGSRWTEYVSIVGCDLNEGALETGCAGVYGEWSFRGEPARRARELHFRDLGGGRWGISPAIPAAVRLVHASIQEHLASCPPGTLDVVLFRNVAVYFQAGALAELYARMSDVLAPAGLLCLAPADPPPAGFVCDDPALSIFERRAAAEPLAPAGPLLAPAPAPAPAQPEPQGPRSADHFTRGQLALIRGDVAEAIMDLRRALYLDPGHRLGRYWYAVALSRGGEPQARRQLRELARQLEGLDDDVRLEDGETEVASLRRAARDLREVLG